MGNYENDLRKVGVSFFHIYIARYVKYLTAEFQKELFDLTEQENLMLYEIIAFRGSAESTIMAHSLPISVFVGCSQKNIY